MDMLNNQSKVKQAAKAAKSTRLSYWLFSSLNYVTTIIVNKYNAKAGSFYDNTRH